MAERYGSYGLYWGDLHNHCGISYGHGSLERALVLARQQLDFASVTGHAFWPDMPTDRERYGRLIDYHRAGFAKLHAGWEAVQRTLAAAAVPGRFVPFLSYEWHSCADGDHHVLYRGVRGPLVGGESLAALRANLTDTGQPFLLVPHHTGYPLGARGTNWAAYEASHSPVVEIYSLHGCAESDEAPYPMLHTMGPRDHDGTAREGLERGHRFGFIASTDHHAGYPGSYGDGRLAVYAPALTAEALWEALCARRTYAVTGDKIVARFQLNDAILGEETLGTRRELVIEAVGDDLWDTVEVVKNGRVWRRWAPVPASPWVAGGAGGASEAVRAKVRVEWGWGRPEEITAWDLSLDLEDGRIVDVETCFRGEPVVRRDQIAHVDETIPHQLHSCTAQHVAWSSQTRGNVTTRHATTQAIVFTVEMPAGAAVTLRANTLVIRYPLRDLLAGARAQMTQGLTSPAVRIHRALPLEDCTFHASTLDEAPERPVDYYYVRLAQRNGQCAWLSPIWVTS